jgi:hypothetical protein
MKSDGDSGSESGEDSESGKVSGKDMREDSDVGSSGSGSDKEK